MAYTPGPWKLFKDTGNDVYQITDGHGAVVIADFVNKDNADLIAAAPDLLEACKAIYSYAHEAEHAPLAALDPRFAKMINDKVGPAIEGAEPKGREDHSEP